MNSKPPSSSTAAIPISKKPSSQPRYPKTLAFLFRHFIGTPLSVELKTGRLYEGILTESDDFGNLTLEDAHETLTGGRRSDNIHQHDISSSSQQRVATFASLHIRGPTIRYVHFPPDADLAALIRKGMDRERSAAQTYARGKRSSRKPPA